MSDIWEGATWNENGELVLDIYAIPPEPKETEQEETDNGKEADDTAEHTYATIDCGGECEECIALIVDGDVISGPPFHPNCDCELTYEDIEEAKYHESNLHDTVGADRNSRPDDVKWLKESLEKLGFYNPDTRAGESAGEPNPYPNQRLFDAIDKFRKLQKIKETGSVKPGHWTEIKINEALKQPKEVYEYRGATFTKPINVNPNQYAVFDGKAFTVHMGNGHTIKFDAVSGRPDNQDPKYQNVKDAGPIPEGVYVARQEEIQHITTVDAVLGMAAALKINIGAWPGSEVSWGESRVWLEPSKETNTYGRDDFSIHGGWFSGSNGCIDLTDQINNFIALLEFMGKDLIVKVEY